MSAAQTTRTAEKPTEAPEGHRREWAHMALITIGPVIVALLIGGLVLIAMGVNPLTYYSYVAGRGLFSPSGLQATLTYRELLGAEYLCHADTPLGTIRYVRKNQLRENSGDIPQPGDRITLYFSLHDLHLFSGQNQQNLHRENHHHA